MYYFILNASSYHVLGYLNSDWTLSFDLAAAIIIFHHLTFDLLAITI